MNKIPIFLVAMSCMAKSYDYYDCDSLYNKYKSEYNNASGQYTIYKQNAYKRYCGEILGKAPDKSNYFINEPEDQIRFLEIQKRTLGIACAQIEKGIQISYKHEYCDMLKSFDIEPIYKNTSLPASNELKIVQHKQIEPAIQYKNTPQLNINELHIYAINNVKYFRDKKDTVLIESSIGNFAVPIKDLKEAERINFTVELSQKLNTLIKE